MIPAAVRFLCSVKTLGGLIAIAAFMIIILTLIVSAGTHYAP